MADRKKSLDPVVLYRVEMPKIAAASAGTDGKRSTFVCNIGALSSSERARYGALGKKLLASRQAVKELANGYAFQFPSDSETIQSAAEWITMERKCCPFFGFDLKIESEGGPLWLQLTGPEGVKSFAKQEFMM